LLVASKEKPSARLLATNNQQLATSSLSLRLSASAVKEFSKEIHSD
jgi:hypothetical protein